MKKKTLPQVAGALVLVALAWLYQEYVPTTTEPGGSDSHAASQALTQAHSDEWVKVSGVVSRILSDDLEGSKHQRFVLRLPHGQTLLVAHNIDLAPRVPIAMNDPITAYGEFQWNDKGGVLHWTHHDPQGRYAGGWISHRDKKYQ